MAPRKCTSQPGDYIRKFNSGTYGPSVITTYELATATKKLELPEGYSTRKPEPNELPNQSSNPNDLCVYWDHVRLGLTFFHLQMISSFLNLTQFSLSMMTPNLVCILVTLYRFCISHSIIWNHDIFFHLFILKHTNTYVSFRPRSTTFISHGLESSIHGWKTKFFFITSPKGWDIPIVPGPDPGVITVKTKCPFSLQEWFDLNPMPFYVLDVESANLLWGHVKKSSETPQKDKDPETEPSPSKRQKVEKLDSTSSGSTDSSESTSNNYSPDTDVDITGEDPIPPADETTDAGTSRRVEESDEVAAPRTDFPYFINPAGNLEITQSDFSPMDDPHKSFGSLLFNFLKSDSVIGQCKKMKHSSVLDFFYSTLISAGRIGSYLGETTASLRQSSSKWNIEYEKMKTKYEDAMKRIHHLEYTESGASERRPMTALEISLTGEVNMMVEMVEEISKLHSEKKEEVDMLQQTVTKCTTTMTEQENRIKELELQLSQQASTSGSKEISDEDKLKSLENTLAYAKEMVGYLKGGFEKFRRAALRRFTKADDVKVLESIDFLVAEREEDISDNDEDES